MARLLAIILIIFSISSCGFKAIYSEKNQNSYNKKLAAIVIKKDRNRLSQILKNNLYDLFNPSSEKVEKKYILKLTINESLSSTYISETGASGRNKITLNVAYSLYKIIDKELVSSGSVSVNDNYDVSYNRFATSTMEDYVKENLLKTAAAEIRNDIVQDLQP